MMGHEMGHYVLGHVGTLILYLSLMIVAFLLFLWWVTPRILARYGERWGVRDVADPAVTPLFAMLAAVAGLIATPLFNTIIRTHEIQADAFGLDAAREPDGFASTAMKLSEYRKIEPSALEEAFSSTIRRGGRGCIWRWSGKRGTSPSFRPRNARWSCLVRRQRRHLRPAADRQHHPADRQRRAQRGERRPAIAFEQGRQRHRDDRHQHARIGRARRADRAHDRECRG